MQGVGEEFNTTSNNKLWIETIESKHTPEAQGFRKKGKLIYMIRVPVTDDENLVNKAKPVIKDGCRVKALKVTATDRKERIQWQTLDACCNYWKQRTNQSIMSGCKYLNDSVKNIKRCTDTNTCIETW